MSDANIQPEAWWAAYRAGREDAARDLRAEAAKRAATACCEATGECGMGDCPADAATVSAYEDAAYIAETGV